MKSLSLKAKLLGSFALTSMLFALVAGINFYYVQKVDAEYSKVTEGSLPNVASSMKMRIESLILSRAVARLGLGLLANNYDAKTAEAIAQAKSSYANARIDYLKVPFGPGEKELFDTTEANYAKVIDIVEAARAIAESADRTRFPEFLKVRERFLTADLGLQDSLDLLVSYQVKGAEATRHTAEAMGKTGIAISLMLGLIGALIGLSLGYFISSRLDRDLSNIVARVEAASSEVAAAASQIATSSTELSESSTQQAAAIQETAASVDEVSAMIKKNSENAGRSADTSRSSKDTAESGSRQVETMVQSIGAIADANERIMRQVDEGNREIADIVKVINEIGSKTKVINDIVFQTKLLSFNASVEAARAGEHGKGFAVVAEEVGNLAQMSGNAAKEITEMLDASVKKVEGIVSRTKEGVAVLIADAKHKVETGTDVAGTCGDALRQVTTSVNSVDQLVTEIAHASREQATGMGEITKAMAQLDQATSQNSTVSQQCAAASEQLSAQAQQMKQLVSELNELLRGAGQAAAAPVSYVSQARRAEKPAGNVVALKRPAAPARAPFKKAAGSDLPAADDPRFEDV